MSDTSDDFLDFGEVYDPAIAATISQGERRMAKPVPKKKSAKASKEKDTDGRGKPGNAGRVGQDVLGREKVTFNLPIRRQNLVREMAQAEDVSQADIVEAGIVALYNAWQAGKVDLESLKGFAKSLRVTHKLEVPDDFYFSP